MRALGKSYKIVFRKPEEKRLFESPWCGWKDNIKVDLRETGCGVCTGWLRISSNGGLL
jgi:hypothetical protein